MKILALSHACVTPVNQAFFATIQRLTGWAVTLVVPETWHGEYGLKTATRWGDFEGKIIRYPVLLSGNVPLHTYRSLFVSLLRKEQPDAIYVHHEPYGLATFQMYMANQWVGHRPIGFFTWQNITKTYPTPIRHLESWVYRTSNFAFAGSESAIETLMAKGYHGPVTLLPGSISRDRHAPSLNRGATRSRIGATNDELVIGFMGRIVREKGLSCLLRALDMIRELPWRCVIVGDGEACSTLQMEAAKLDLKDRVLFTGYVPHVEAPSYLSAFDVTVMPSETQANWREQFGRVIIESMACGTPVIGSDSGEIPNLIRRTGGGVVFPEGNAEAFAERLRTLLLDDKERNSLAKYGRQSVIQDYTDEAVARKFIQSIKSYRDPVLSRQ
jgi:glycosyltransferase involved in cell wall biosynthesis